MLMPLGNKTQHILGTRCLFEHQNCRQRTRVLNYSSYLSLNLILLLPSLAILILHEYAYANTEKHALVQLTVIHNNP